MASMELELVGAIYTALNTDSTLTTASGINPATGAARVVTVHNQVVQNQPVPYVRISLTDSQLIDDEPFGYGYVPVAKSIFLLVDVFSDYEIECWNIAARLEALLKHREITTANYYGGSWMQSTDFFVDNISDVPNVYRRGSLRVRVNLEPIS